MGDNPVVRVVDHCHEHADHGVILAGRRRGGFPRDVAERLGCPPLLSGLTGSAPAYSSGHPTTKPSPGSCSDLTPLYACYPRPVNGYRQFKGGVWLPRPSSVRRRRACSQFSRVGAVFRTKSGLALSLGAAAAGVRDREGVRPQAATFPPALPPGRSRAVPDKDWFSGIVWRAMPTRRGSPTNGCRDHPPCGPWLARHAPGKNSLGDTRSGGLRRSSGLLDGPGHPGLDRHPDDRVLGVSLRRGRPAF